MVILEKGKDFLALAKRQLRWPKWEYVKLKSVSWLIESYVIGSPDDAPIDQLAFFSLSIDLEMVGPWFCPWACLDPEDEKSPTVHDAGSLLFARVHRWI